MFAELARLMSRRRSLRDEVREDVSFSPVALLRDEEFEDLRAELLEDFKDLIIGMDACRLTSAFRSLTLRDSGRLFDDIVRFTSLR
mmetsp:Transcript_11107/g.21142  ORF Transcript_11107/g.21142 Transcript_11107/m.21142 type:complete len:86 (+) Transcript_11107:344-601(+)